MAFEKGNNLGGRKVGSKNKTTEKIREQFSLLLSENLEQLTEDFKAIENPKDRIKLLIYLAGYVIPKLKAVELQKVEQRTDKLFSIRDIYKSNENDLLND